MRFILAVIPIIIGLLGIYLNQRNATVLESPEIYIYIECQTESRNDPHISRDFNSVERGPGYIVNENISVDTGQGSSLPLKGGFIERSNEKLIALEGRYPELLRSRVEHNTKIQETLVRAKDLGESLKNNQ